MLPMHRARVRSLVRKLDAARMLQLRASMPQLKKKKDPGTSLVAQRLRIRLPVQGTQVRALVREDPTCCRAAEPMHHNY